MDPYGLEPDRETINNRPGPIDQSGRTGRTGNPISGPYRAPPTLTDRIMDRVVDGILKQLTGVGGLVTRSPVAIAIPLILHDGGLACGTLDCNNNGVPDHEENKNSRKE